MSLQRAREVFLNPSTIRSSCAGCRGLALICEKPSFFKAFRHSADEVDAEPFGDDALEVDPPPANDAVLLTIRSDLDDPRDWIS